MAASEVRTWMHSRKGRIDGFIVDDTDPEWVTIRLAAPVDGVTVSWETGGDLTVRRSFLTEVTG